MATNMVTKKRIIATEECVRVVNRVMGCKETAFLRVAGSRLLSYVTDCVFFPFSCLRVCPC